MSELLSGYNPEKIDEALAKLMEKNLDPVQYPPDFLQRLRQAVRVVHYDHGEMVFAGEGEVPDAIREILPLKDFMILIGNVQLTRIETGIKNFGVGDYFGLTYRRPDRELLQLQARVISEEGADLLVIPHDTDILTKEETKQRNEQYLAHLNLMREI